MWEINMTEDTKNDINPITGAPLWTELDVARLLDAGKAYIDLIDNAVIAVQERLKCEQVYKTAKEQCDRAVYMVEGMHNLYDRIFCDVELKMWPQFQDNQEIKDMREKVFEKNQEYCRVMKKSNL